MFTLKADETKYDVAAGVKMNHAARRRLVGQFTDNFVCHVLDDRRIPNIRRCFQVDCSGRHLSLSGDSYAPPGPEPHVQGHLGLHQANMEVRKNARFL